jgi:cytoskeleton-associated protein 5
MVRKKDGLWRPCGDYRLLNLATPHDRYPLPSILDLSNKLHGCKFFSCIDLVKGYHQIPMAAQDVAKTAIITPFGLFEYLFMPFRLRNAAQTFQRFMEEHHKHLRQIFTILQENGLLINPAKCVFARTLQTLTNALRGAPKTPEWPPAAAFGLANAALAAAVPLVHPALNAVLSLATDASDTHVGGVLQQLNGGSWQPLVFLLQEAVRGGHQVLHL